MAHALAFDYLKNKRAEPASPAPLQRNPVPEALQNSPQLEPLSFGRFECDFDEPTQPKQDGTTTKRPEQGRATSFNEQNVPQTPKRYNERQSSHRQDSSMSGTVVAGPSSLAPVPEIRLSDIEGAALQQMAAEVQSEPDITQRSKLLGQISKSLPQHKRGGSPVSAAESSVSEATKSKIDELCLPSYRFRCANKTDWDDQTVLLDLGSRSNLVEEHYAGEILGLDIGPVPADIHLGVGASGHKVTYAGAVNITWKASRGRGSRTSTFLVVDDLPYCIVFGRDTIFKQNLLAEGILVLFPVTRDKEEIRKQKEREQAQAALRAEAEKRQDEEERRERARKAAEEKERRARDGRH